VLLLFDGLGMPPVAGKPFVLVNTCGWMISGSDEDRTLSFHYALGFMVGEDAESVSVLDRSLAVVKCAKHTEPPPDWEHFRKDHPEDLPLPGEKKESDFAEFCRSFLFEASRTSAAAGVTVVVSIEAADPREAPEAGRARCEKDLRLGPERVEGVSHTCPLAAKDHLLPEEAVRMVLSGAPEVPFLLRFVLTVHRP
jgi:hypothetical protein